MENWVKIASTDAVPADKALVVEHCARRIAIYREGEAYFAIEDICPHMGAFLSNGFRAPGIVICPWHNWKFSLMDGQCLATQNACNIATFPLRIADGELWLPAEFPEDELL
jgi:nitrite reductase (NADH) small subunit/3-phenylpropionate/trans-cinnamate dioxygenase ferredoxin subunit